MTKKTNDENKNLTKYLPWLLLLPLILLVVFCFLFFSDFPVYLGTEQSWLNTASIVNGFVTPILTFATIILLWLTWNTSKKELQETREQLSFQSSRDTLLIILDDLLVTLNYVAKPHPNIIESCAKYRMKMELTEDGKNSIFSLSNSGFQVNSLAELVDIIEKSIKNGGEKNLQNMIQNFMNHLNEGFDKLIYGQLIYTQYLIKQPEFRVNIESPIDAIVSIMDEKLSNKRFELLSQIILSKLTFEVVIYFLMDVLYKLEYESPCDADKIKLQNKVDVLNKIFCSTGKIDFAYDKFLTNYKTYKPM